MARLSVRVVLKEVFKRFSAWEVDWNNVVQAYFSIVCGWEELPVTAAARPALLGWA